MPDLSVIVEQCLAPVPGGTGRYAQQITAALAANPRPGWHVRTVTAWHRDTADARIPGTTGPRRLPAGHRVLNALWQRGLPPTVNGERVHATTPLAPNRRHGLVVTVHDAVPWTHPETLTPRGVSWHRTMISRAVDRADAIVVPSEAVADDLSGLFPSASGRFHRIAHGVSALPVPVDAAARRRRLSLPDRYVLTIATVEPRKGLDVLLKAMAEMPTERVGLAVVGATGWGEVNVPALAAAAGMPAGRVHQLGRLNDVDLSAVLDGAAVLAAPSRSEGFGLPVLEAMAAGVPVICSDAPALVELAGDVGLVVPREDDRQLAEAIEAVLVDGALAHNLAARGRVKASGYTWSSAADRLWDIHLGHLPAPG